MSAFRDRLSRVRWKRLILVGGGAGTLVLVLGVGIGYAMTDVPEPSDVATGQSTVIRYADGGDITVLGKNRVSVPLSQVPDHVQKAVLAAEDRGFYTEPGISPKGIARALFTNIKGGGGIQQGGSTITQQYAKNAFLTSERTYTRKVKEVFIAVKMSRTVEKDKVLEDYLNTIYFGRGADGIQVASQTYFGKDVSKLTVAEGAVLASVIRSPANYDPVKHRDRAQERMDYVLDGMVEKGWLEQAESDAVRFPAVKPLGSGSKINDLSGPKGHVVNQVLEELEREGIPESEVVAGGYVVTTTLRKAPQEAAIKAVQAAVGDGKDEKALQGALVSVEPGTGKVIAYYGGGTGTGFDYANQGNGRPAGSTMKPYVLGAALEEDISLTSRFDGDSPKAFGATDVSNFGGQDFGPVDLVEATKKSVNTAYFELGQEVGATKVQDFAKKAGVPTPLGGDAPATGIALGIYDVHVLDQAVGYATFAKNGTQADARFVEKVADRKGKSVYELDIETRQAFSEDVAADATFAMRQVVEGGTGARSRLADGRPSAGKTGTSQDNKDAWFVGFVPQVSTAVWLGYGQPRKITIDGVDATGGGFSTRIWKAYMDVAVQGVPVAQFPDRADVGKAQDPAPAPSQPSASPTSASPSPSATPSELPSEAPSLVPTLEPTKKPPGKPSPSPTAEPSTAPPEQTAPASPAAQASPSG